MTFNEWLAAQVRSFHARGDRERLDMVRCYLRGYDDREKDPDAALDAFADGRQRARLLDEPWWVLFYEEQRLEALMHFKRDYRDVLDEAVRCVMELRKPGNANFPGRHAIWDGLVSAYLGIDAEGHAEQVREALDHLDAEIPPEPDGARYLLLARRRIFALECDDLQGGYDSCMRELELAGADGDSERAVHFATFTYCGLCEVAAGVGDWQAVASWAATGEELARARQHHCELGETLAWQAAAASRLGDVERARRLLRTATSHISRLKMPPKRGYYDALADYHEHAGDLPAALAVRDEELRTIEGRGRLLYECRVRLRRAELLARMGQLRRADLAEARAAAGKLRLPEKYLEQIDRLEAG